jgi:hypothetical protein
MPTKSPTEAQCKEFDRKLRSSIDEFWNDRLKVIDDTIRAEEKAGRDPRNYAPNEAVKIDLIKLKQQLDSKRVESHTAASAQIAQCNKGAVPNWIGDAQKVLDAGTLLALAPFVLLLQEYKQFNVDLGEIYKGRPLGGNKALIPKMRDDVLGALGLKGTEIAKILSDPVHAVKDFPENAAREIGKFLRKPFG